MIEPLNLKVLEFRRDILGDRHRDRYIQSDFQFSVDVN